MNKRFRWAREQAGFSREAAAPLLGIGARTLERYESGERRIPAGVIALAARAYKVNEAYLAGQIDEPEEGGKDYADILDPDLELFLGEGGFEGLTEGEAEAIRSVMKLAADARRRRNEEERRSEP